MGTVTEKFYFKGQQISKQTLNKYIKWGGLLSAIKNGADNPAFLKERCGQYTRDAVHHMKNSGLVKTIGNGIHSLYSVTEKGEQLIKDVKQYEREKKNEQI